MAALLRFGKSLHRAAGDAPPRPVPEVRNDVEPELTAGMQADLSGLGSELDAEDAAALTQRMLRLSLAFFAAEVIRGDVTSRTVDGDPDAPVVPHTGHTVIAEHHLEWDAIIRKHRQLCIIAPRDHSKSHFFTIAYPIWEAWRRPGVEIVIFSETQPQAEKQLAKLKTEIENNPRLAHLRDPSRWSAKSIRLSNGSTITAAGFGTKTRGAHPHLIVCDDIVSEAAMYSELVRERQHNAFLANVRNQLVPGGTLVVVGTPQHLDDLYAKLAANPEWFFKRYQAIDKNGRILFPERYDRARLEARRREIGEIRFQREFLGLPVGSGMSLFPDELVSGEPFFQPLARIGAYLRDDTGKEALDARGHRIPMRTWWVHHGVSKFYAGVDIARSSNVSADWFVIFVIGLDARGNRWVVDIRREQGLGYKTQKALIVEVAKLWRCELTAIEANAAQSIYGEEIRTDTDVAVHLHHTGSEKHSLEKGIPSLRLFFEQQKYRCPRGDEESVLVTTQWIGEVQAWTFTKDKGVVSVARHDDVAMAQWLCEIAIARGEAFSFAFGEQAGDREAAEELAREEAALFAAPAQPKTVIPGVTLEPAPYEDPWITMGLDPSDMAAVQGRRGNLDFGGVSGTQGVVPATGHPGQTAPPVHPLGPGIPLMNLIRRSQ